MQGCDVSISSMKNGYELPQYFYGFVHIQNRSRPPPDNIGHTIQGSMNKESVMVWGDQILVLI